ncbi:MAG: helix-turn-helix transcriptional regulator [Proteobacteria bacterium]|nr:helix-turn-helix transcriptional regulator [Pseudomonadota bacterium]
MEINDLLTEEAILAELGARITHRRLTLQMTQAELAEQSGVAKRTVERIEAGASAQMATVIRILRVLDLLTNLEQLISPSRPGPMTLLKHEGVAPKRASRSRKSADQKPWTWDEPEERHEPEEPT